MQQIQDVVGPNLSRAVVNDGDILIVDRFRPGLVVALVPEEKRRSKRSGWISAQACASPEKSIP